MYTETKWMIAGCILVVLILVGVVGGSYVYEETGPGGYLTDTPQMDAKFVSRMEAKGKDIRIYEFVPKIDESRVCIFVVGNKKGGLQCWEKSQ